MRSFVYPVLLVFFLVTGIFIPLEAGEGSVKGDGKEGPRKQAAMLDTLFWAPEIVVEGIWTAPDRDILDSSGFVGLIEIDREQEIMADVANVLSRAAGVNIRQYGGLGSYSTMSIRGSSSTQVQFYLDGVPINDSYSGNTDLSDISLEDIGRIEIYRGFSPSNFGSSSIGGTVNLVSRASEDASPAGLSGQITTGSFGAERYSVTASGEAGPAYMRLHGGSTRSRGDFDYFDDNATPYDLSDDENSTRKNNDFKRGGLSDRLGLDLPGFDDFSASFNSFFRNGGVPGTGADQTSLARLERSRRMTYLKAEPVPLLSNRIHLGTTIFHTWTAERFDDPEGDISLSRQLTDNRITSWGGSLRSKVFPRSLPVTLSLFLEHRREIFHPVSLIPYEVSGPDRKRKSTTINLSGDLLFFKEALILTASQRSEFYENEFYDETPFPWIPPTPQGKQKDDMHTPAFGFRYRVAGGMTIKGNYGYYYRTPTFFEMFGNLGTVTGDSALRPESGVNRDIGIVMSRKKAGAATDLFLEATCLYNEVEDLILFFPNSQSTVKPQNIGKATVRGVELSLAATLPWNLSLSGNYCWLSSKDTGPTPYYNGNDLPGRPGHKASGWIEYKKPRWSLSYRLDRIGSNYLDRYNTKMVDSRTLHGIRLLIRPVGRNLSVILEGANLGGERAFDVSGFPLPGRSWYTSMVFDL